MKISELLTGFQEAHSPKSKYAQMRKDRMKEQKIEMMSEAYKRAERSEDAMEMLMPIVKRG